MNIIDIKQVMAVSDKALFDSIESNIITAPPERYYPNNLLFRCGIVHVSPRTYVGYTFHYEKSIETWTPLFDSHKSASLWSVNL